MEFGYVVAAAVIIGFVWFAVSRSKKKNPGTGSGGGVPKPQPPTHEK